MEHQADPSAPLRLLGLPVSCLHHIVSFMDKETKFQFFRTSKGSQDEPGCAVLVLRAFKLVFTYTVQPDNVRPRPALCSLLHWASQISTDVELTMAGQRAAGFEVTEALHIQFHDPLQIQLPDVLHSLLLYPGARATPSGRVLGKPATYPGVTSLKLQHPLVSCTCSSLIPGLVADAFPNLKNIDVMWSPDASQPLGPVLERGLQSVQHVHVSINNKTSNELKPAASQHIAQQLSHMPSLTSINVSNQVFLAVPAAVLAKLKKLVLYAQGDPTAEDKAALKACSQLESLHILQSDRWVPALPLHAPSIRVLEVVVALSDQQMPSLLALPHLTSLTVKGVLRFSDDYSSAPCSWKHVDCHFACTSDITKLPLHTLDSPIKCTEFYLILSDHAADLAAIRAAKPHLLRCGGIQVDWEQFYLQMVAGSSITKEQAAEVLAEWAPCLSVPQCVSYHARLKPIIEDAVARLWPEAELDCWQSEDPNEEA